jgi:hypothetical protein
MSKKGIQNNSLFHPSFEMHSHAWRRQLKHMSRVA